MDKIKIGICGYGNLGKGVEIAVLTEIISLLIFPKKTIMRLKTLQKLLNWQVQVSEKLFF